MGGRGVVNHFGLEGEVDIEIGAHPNPAPTATPTPTPSPTPISPPHQIADEIFLENINNVLSAGEVPNLFEEADLGTIFEKMNPLVVQAGLPINKTNLYAMFVKQVERHPIPAPSPVPRPHP